jgi:hypothetical protein
VLVDVAVDDWVAVLVLVLVSELLPVPVLVDV